MKKISLVVTSFALLSACSPSETSFLGDQSMQSGIIGGQAAEGGQEILKSTASMMFEYQGKMSQECTATLISKNLMVTAAHCVKGAPVDKIRMFFGQRMPTDPKSRSLLSVHEVIVSPDFGDAYDGSEFPWTYLNDIAVLRLSEDAPEGAVPVPVLSDKTPLKGTEKLLLAGYGWINDEEVIRSKVLNYTYVNIYKLWSSIIVTDQTNGTGACKGDSGGPAYLETAQGLVVVGATRGPHDMASHCHAYGEYTNVSKFKDFLIESAQKLEAEEPRFIEVP